VEIRCYVSKPKCRDMTWSPRAIEALDSAFFLRFKGKSTPLTQTAVNSLLLFLKPNSLFFSSSTQCWHAENQRVNIFLAGIFK
jgi:hypothetical protein